MKKVKLNVPIKNLNGEAIESQDNLGQIIANAIVSQTEGQSVKLFEIALQLNKGEFQLDSADYDLLKKSIESSKFLSVLVKGQALKILE